MRQRARYPPGFILMSFENAMDSGVRAGVHPQMKNVRGESRPEQRCRVGACVENQYVTKYRMLKWGNAETHRWGRSVCVLPW